jgi:hypothetical protein
VKPLIWGARYNVQETTPGEQQCAEWRSYALMLLCSLLFSSLLRPKVVEVLRPIDGYLTTKHDDDDLTDNDAACHTLNMPRNPVRRQRKLAP